MPPLAAIPLLIATAGPPYVIKEIRDGLYWLSDGAYNTMFLVTSEGVIAIDPLPTLGPRYLERTAEEVLAEEPFPVYLGRRGPI